MKRHLAGGALAALCLGLAACGGGGGDSGTPAQPTTVNAAAAWRNLMTLPHSWSLSGTGSDGNAYQFSITIATAGTEAFPVTGVSANKVNFTSVIAQGGVTIASGLVENYLDADLRVVGARTTGAGIATTCDIATSSSLLPSSATVGASGALDEMNDLPDCSSTSASTGTTVDTWEIQQNDGIVYFCVKSVDQDLDVQPTVETETDCIQVDADGNLGTRAIVTLTSPDLSITLSN